MPDEFKANQRLFNERGQRLEEYRQIMTQLEARIAELEAFIVDEVDPLDLCECEREKWYALHKKLHPENYRSLP